MPGPTIESDPNIVFTPEYWGELSPPPENGGDFPYPRFRTGLEAAKILSPVIDKIISGELTGHEMARGVVYNPLDQDLSQNSVYNMPGSILLADFEIIEPAYSAEDLEPPKYAETDPEHVFTTPRTLIQTRVKVDNQGYMRAGGHGRLKFNNGELIYSRTAAIIINAPAKKGAVVPVSPFGSIQIATPSGFQANKVTNTYPEIQLEGLQTVGESIPYSHDPQARIRLRSLELCAAGERIEAKAPSFASRFLGRAASSQA